MVSKKHFQDLAERIGAMPYADIEREDVIQMVIEFASSKNERFDPARFRDAVYEAQSERVLKKMGYCSTRKKFIQQ